MRDVRRIWKFCVRLGANWEDYFPDLRFGQLMVNFLGWYINKYHNDFFYLEEDMFMERFEEYCRAVAKNL